MAYGIRSEVFNEAFWGARSMNRQGSQLIPYNMDSHGNQVINRRSRILPPNPLGLWSLCTSASAIFTQVKCVGDALKQNAG